MITTTKRKYCPYCKGRTLEIIEGYKRTCVDCGNRKDKSAKLRKTVPIKIEILRISKNAIVEGATSINIKRGGRRLKIALKAMKELGYFSRDIHYSILLKRVNEIFGFKK